MSASLFTLGTRLRAQAERKAVLCGTGRFVNIHKSACLVSVVAMGGEHSGTWGVAIGEIGTRKPKMFTCGDPSNYLFQIEMWDELERYLMAYVTKSVEAGLPPQIVCANKKTWGIIAETAGRVSLAKNSPKALRLARTLIFANDRAALDGDPTVVFLAELLSSVFVCGSEPTYDSNLQNVMMWIEGEGALNTDGNSDTSISALVIEDDDCFLPPAQEDEKFADAYIKFKQQEVKPQVSSERSRVRNAASYSYKLHPVLVERWKRLRDAVNIYNAAPLEDVPEIDALQSLSFKRWESFLSKLEEVEAVEETRLTIGQPKNPDSVSSDGVNEVDFFNESQNAELIGSLTSSTASEPLDGQPDENFNGGTGREYETRATSKKKFIGGKYDTVRERNEKLAERNSYADQWASTLVWRDRYEKAKAFADGRIIQGVVVAKEEAKTCVRVEHSSLRVRTGDELTSFANPKIKIKVLSLESTEDDATIVCVSDLTFPQIGDMVEYGPQPPDIFQLSSRGGKRNRQLSIAGWTQSTYKAPPSQLNAEPPENILEAVNKARAV